jgi:hypothetical protein
MTLPGIIPLFPLPNVVFFPRQVLPLHIFEPRYRAMVRDAAGGARLIGMVLLRGDWERNYQGRPPIFGTGTVGEMARIEELPDGRVNIVLRGLREFAVTSELTRAAYREGVVTWREPAAAVLPDATRGAVAALVGRYVGQLGQSAGTAGVAPAGVDDETFVNFLAQHLDVAPVEKQALLEAATLGERAERLIEVLEFRLREPRGIPGAPPARTH